MTEYDLYKPISEAPVDSKEVRALSTMYDQLEARQGPLYARLSKLFRLPGEVHVTPNGSFHAFDVDITYVFKLKKWNPYSYPPYAKFPLAPDSSYVKDHDIFYLYPEEYQFFITERNLEDMHILDETEVAPNSFRREETKYFSTPAEVIAYLDSQKERAQKLWTLSRKNI